MNAPQISVIIPVYNDAQRLGRCLQALACQTLSPRYFEVLVVDNGSQRDPLPLIARLARIDELRVRVLREPSPGSYRARNAGLRQASGDVLAFTDADCRPRAHWLQRARDLVWADPDVGFIGGRIAIQPGDPRRPRMMELYEMALAMVQEDLVRDRGFAATANMITTRRTIERVGVFDDALQSGGDAQWGRRVLRAGLHACYADDVVVDHSARATFAEVFSKTRRVASGTQQHLQQSTPHSAPAGTPDVARPEEFRRGAWQKLERLNRRTRDWSTARRCKALLGAVVAEAMVPAARFDLSLRGTARRL